ncbi:WD repeat-containing protein VIP3 [Tanacetum coccineum]
MDIRDEIAASKRKLKVNSSSTQVDDADDVSEEVEDEEVVSDKDGDDVNERVFDVDGNDSGEGDYDKEDENYEAKGSEEDKESEKDKESEESEESNEAEEVVKDVKTKVVKGNNTKGKKKGVISKSKKRKHVFDYDSSYEEEKASKPKKLSKKKKQVLESSSSSEDEKPLKNKKKHAKQGKDEEVIGKLDLHETWIESEVDQTEGFYDVGDNVSRSRTSVVPPTDKQSFCRMIEEKILMISAEKVALEDLLKRANTEFPNDKNVIELYKKYGRLFKEAVFPKDSQAHLDDFDNNDGGGDNDDDDGFDNVEKDKESADEAAVNEGKDGVNADKEAVNAEKEGEADVNEEQEDIIEEETFTLWIETNIEWTGEMLAPRLWIDANVIDCWVAILNHEELVKESDEQVSLLRRMRFKIATKILLHELNVHAQKMFDLDYKFETENDEQTRISIIVNAIKNRAECDPAKTNIVVENQEEDAVKSKSEQVLMAVESTVYTIGSSKEEFCQIKSVDFYWQGTTLAVAGGSSASVKLWDTAKWKQIGTLSIPRPEGSKASDKRNNKKFVLSVAWSPSGRQLACGCMDGSIVFDIQRAKFLHHLEGHTMPVCSLAYSPLDPRVLVSGSDDERIHMYDAEGKTLFLSMSVKFEAAGSGARGSLLASVSDDKSISLYNYA